MKIAIVGGAGVRVPLLVHGLTHSELPIKDIALYDTDMQRLAPIARLAQLRAAEARIHPCTKLDECLLGADCVFTSIRAGGIAQRARDERISIEHGCIGQETVGPAGFAMAMRTIPEMIHYAERIRAIAPQAWIINFTNPVGMITQAMHTLGNVKAIGICDTPTELFEDAAHVLGLNSSRCHFDYLGINHLGWLREIYFNGEPQLHRLWGDPGRLRQVYRTALFEDDFLAQLKLLPTEYVYYYYRTQRAQKNIAGASSTRGAVVEELNRKLFAELESSTDPVATYEAYIKERDASYMQVESGSRVPRQFGPWAALTGYDKIALATVNALHFNTREEIPLNVLNHGNLSCLQDHDVVEVPCVVNANGALPLHVGAVPHAVQELLTQVKNYERLTIATAMDPSRDRAIEALATNPTVESADVAARLVDALLTFEPRRVRSV